MTTTNLAQVKHYARIQYYRAQDAMKGNWFKFILLFLIAIVFLFKDFSFQLNLQSPLHKSNSTPAAIQHIDNEAFVDTPTPKAAPVAHIIKNEAPKQRSSGLFSFFSASAAKAKDKPTKEVDENLANTFSNLTLILSPSYAKRNNIDPSVVAYKKQIVEDYLGRFAPIAISEMNKYNIPASITLAQGLLESNVGDSRLAKRNNNHFGIKCFSKNCKKGHCSNFTDDSHKDFFRKYDSTWESYRAHSDFLQRKRYKHLLKLDKTDYKAWAKGLRKAGYATDKKYANKLIRIIEELKLYEYDEE